MADTSVRDRFSQLLFYGLVFLTGYLAFQVISPFLSSLAWAAVFAMMFHQVHLELAKRMGPNRGALVTTLLAAVLIVAPGVMLVSVLAREVPQVLEYVQQASLTAPDRIERLWEMARHAQPVCRCPRIQPSCCARVFNGRWNSWRRAQALWWPTSLSTLGSLFVMLFALFFLLRDGPAFGRQIRDLLPLPDRERDRLIEDTRDLVVASVGVGLLVAAVQGTIGGIAFWLLGIGAPVIWGVVMAMCALIPIVGSALVWVPAALWLMFTGSMGRGVILILVGVLGIGMADNILRPLLLSGRTSGERPRHLHRPARRRGGVRLHRPRSRADHPRHRRQPVDGVHTRGPGHGYRPRTATTDNTDNTDNTDPDRGQHGQESLTADNDRGYHGKHGDQPRITRKTRIPPIRG